MGGAQSKKITKKFDSSEVDLITALFNDLAVPVKGTKLIDRDGFKRFHMIPEPLSDRIFSLFEQKKSSQMHLEDLLAGLAVIGKSTEKEKVDVIFKFLDLDDDGVITKEELSVLSIVALESANSPKINSNATPEDPIISQIVGMGFPKSKVKIAFRETKDTHNGSQAQIDKILTWLDQHQNDGIDIDEGSLSPVSDKPDPKTIDELTVGLHLSTILTTFESLFEIPVFKEHGSGKIQIKHFRKWATASKKPAELDSFLKPMSALYDRALKWKQSSLQRSSDILERSISQKELVDNNKAKNTNKNNTSKDNLNPKELKRYSSVSVLENLKQQEQVSKDLKKEPSQTNINTISPPITSPPKKVEKGDSKTSLKQESPPLTTTTTTTVNKGSSSSFTKKDSKSSSTDKTTPPIPEDKSTQDDSDSSFGSDDEEETIKPVIQVVIREKPIELKKQDSLFEIDPSINLSKPDSRLGTQTMKVRGTRASNRYTIDPNMFNTSLEPLTPASSASSTIAPRVFNTTTPPVISDNASSTSGSNSIGFSSNNITPTKNITTPLVNNGVGGNTQKINNESLELMKSSIAKLENGDLSESIVDLDKCIKSLLQLHSTSPQTIQNEINFCVGYKVVLSLLIEIKSLESKVQSEKSFDSAKDYYDRLALLSKFMVDIPIQTNHRIVCAKMAIHYNIISGNYGVAGKLLETLQRKQQQQQQHTGLSGKPLHSSTSAVVSGDHEQSSQVSNSTTSNIEEKLNQCKQHQFENSSLPMYICPTCKSSSTSVDHIQCSCNRPIRWCFSTFDLIKELTFLQCNYCNSTFSINQTDIIPNKTCTFCNHGLIIHK